MSKPPPIRVPRTKTIHRLINDEVARILVHEMPDPSKDWDKTGAKNLVDMREREQAATLRKMKKSGKRKTRRRYTRRSKRSS
jgi:hypothetical protein